MPTHHGNPPVQVTDGNLASAGTDGRPLTESGICPDTISGQEAADAVYGHPIFGRNVRVPVSKSW
jgi:iron complex outermembrane recepter protein